MFWVYFTGLLTKYLNLFNQLFISEFLTKGNIFLEKYLLVEPKLSERMNRKYWRYKINGKIISHTSRKYRINNKQLLNNHIQEVHLVENRVVKQNDTNSHIKGVHFQTENNFDEEMPIIVTNLYRKNTERPRALLPRSCHPGHTSKILCMGCFSD